MSAKEWDFSICWLCEQGTKEQKKKTQILKSPEYPLYTNYAGSYQLPRYLGDAGDRQWLGANVTNVFIMCTIPREDIKTESQKKMYVRAAGCSLIFLPYCGFTLQIARVSVIDRKQMIWGFFGKVVLWWRENHNPSKQLGEKNKMGLGTNIPCKVCGDLLDHELDVVYSEICHKCTRILKVIEYRENTRDVSWTQNKCLFAVCSLE